MACDICERSRTTGWTGLPEGTGHCRDCCAVYSGRMQHCCSCHETFGGDEAATRHQGPDGCRAPGSILHKNGRAILAKNEKGVWVRAFGC